MQIETLVWEMTDDELEQEAARREVAEPEHAAELRWFATERRAGCPFCDEILWGKAGYSSATAQEHLAECYESRKNAEPST